MSTLATERMDMRTQALDTIRTLVSGNKVASVSGWLAVVIVAWFLARALALFMAPPSLPAAPSLSATAALPERKFGPTMPPFTTYAVLQSNNLFNLNSHTPVVVAQPVQVKTLDAYLMGTVEAPKQEDARAVILHQGKQHMLSPGQTIADYVVKEIRRGAVVLESNGKIVELVVTEESGRMATGVAPAGRSGISPATRPAPPRGRE